MQKNSTGNGNTGNAPFCKTTLVEDGQDSCQYHDSEGKLRDCMQKGSYYDRTPGKFDNDYYKLLLEVGNKTYDTCGKIRPKKWEPSVESCEVGKEWCNATLHLTSTQQYANEYNLQRKIAIFNADFSLTQNANLKEVIQAYAQNQTRFFAKFTEVFGAVTKLGYEESDLFQCIPDTCTYNATGQYFDCEQQQSLAEVDRLIATNCTGGDPAMATGCMVNEALFEVVLECDNGVTLVCNQIDAFNIASIDPGPSVASSLSVMTLGPALMMISSFLF